MEVWRRMEGCYNTATNRPPPPNRIMLELITVDWVELYQRVPPPWVQHPSVSGPIAYLLLHPINGRY